FTIEEAWTEGESVNEMEATWVPEELLQHTPQQAIDRLQSIVPHFSYEADKLDSRIIHIKDRRLLGLKAYPLDQEMGPFEFDGAIFKLVEAIARKGVPITPDSGGLAINEQADRHTRVHVKGKSLQVRAALTNFIPLDKKEKGQILWIARTKLDPGVALTTVL